MATKSVKVTDTVSAKHNPSFFYQPRPRRFKTLARSRDTRVETRGDEAGFLLKY